MRPRKRVLLVCSGDLSELRAQLQFKLQVWGYRAIDAVDENEPPPDAVVSVHQALQDVTLAVVKQFPAQVIAMVRNEADGWLVLSVGAHYFAITAEDLRGKLRLACARKRGPKPALTTCTRASAFRRSA